MILVRRRWGGWNRIASTVRGQSQELEMGNQALLE
jgi:hypothetical protein